MLMDQKCYLVYILRCSDESYYTGITNNIERRFAEHQSGKSRSCYTFKRRPVTLLFVQSFLDVKEAIAFEKQVKGWSRAKKEALIAQDFDRLVKLSKNRRQS